MVVSVDEQLQEQHRPQDALDDDVLPSVYSLAPVSIFKESDASIKSANLKPTENSPFPVPLHTTQVSCGDKLEKGVSANGLPLVTDRELASLIELFTQRMIPYNPAIFPEDFTRPSEIVVKYRHLAVCVAYVTARFVPGASSVRKRLFPSVVHFAQRFITNDVCDDAEGVPTLNALMLLLAYTDIPASNAPDVSKGLKEHELMFWPLKSLTESYAIRIQCHRTVGRVHKAIAEEETTWMGLPAFKKYCCWVWLFTMAHCCSLVTSTPPTINADSCIRSSAQILSKCRSMPLVVSLLAEADICLTWDSIRREDNAMGEWWTPRESSPLHTSVPDLSVTEAACRAVADRRKHLQFFAEQDFTRARVEYHIRMAIFCIRSYDVQNMKSSVPMNGPDSRRMYLQMCLEAATDIVDWFLATNLLDRESLRYAADCSLIIPAMACMFVLRSMQVLESWACSVSDPVVRLERVAEMADLLNGLAADPYQGVQSYGNAIQMVVGAMQRKWQSSGQLRSADSHENDHVLVNASSEMSMPVESPGKNTAFGDVSNFDFDDLQSFAGLWDMNWMDDGS